MASLVTSDDYINSGTLFSFELPNLDWSTLPTFNTWRFIARDQLIFSLCPTEKKRSHLKNKIDIDDEVALLESGAFDAGAASAIRPSKADDDDEEYNIEDDLKSSSSTISSSSSTSARPKKRKRKRKRS